MDKAEELIYKLVDDNYSLTEEDKNLLNISLFILVKEQVIKKDIPNKKVYFDCKNKEYIPLILEIGNKIRDIIVADGMSLDQTVSVELLNDYEYKENREELKKAIYYVHRLRDWLVHKDYELVNNKLFIKPFAYDKGDNNYTIELDIADIEKLCNKKAIDFSIDLKNFTQGTYHMRHPQNEYIIMRGLDSRFIINPNTGFVTLVDRNTFHNKFNYTKFERDATKVLEGKSKKKMKVFDMSDTTNGEFRVEDYYLLKGFVKQYVKYNKNEPIVFKFSKIYTEDEATFRSILKQLNIEEDQLNRSNYYLAALYGYATNVYAESDKDHPNPKYFNIRNFKIEKIDNQQFSDQNNSILKSMKEFNDLYSYQKANIESANNLSVQRNINERLLENLLIEFKEIDKYLELQKSIIIDSIRNATDHGNINIDSVTESISLYDTSNNTMNVDDKNCKIKISSDIDTLHRHIDEYKGRENKEYSVNEMLEDVIYFTGDNKVVNKFKQSIIGFVFLLTGKEIDLNKLAITDNYLELKNLLLQNFTEDVKKMK